ncbi:hypothetical protein Ancab_034529 [Ancistrocladus abbreviatus]
MEQWPLTALLSKLQISFTAPLEIDSQRILQPSCILHMISTLQDVIFFDNHRVEVFCILRIWLYEACYTFSKCAPTQSGKYGGNRFPFRHLVRSTVLIVGKP